MKQIFSILLIILLLVSCRNNAAFSKDEMQSMAQMVDNLHETYPLATLQDVYKTCYQDFFGSEHLAPDEASVRAYLAYELSTMDTVLMPLHEPCGWRHQYERVSLMNIRNGIMTEDQLVEAFLSAAEPHTATDSALWVIEWQTIEQIAISRVPQWNDTALVNELRYCADICAPVRQSDAFRNNYFPHYRIIKRN